MLTTTPPLPTYSDRTAIIGATGTGKTVAGIYHLSMMDLRARPWVIFDLKEEEHINAIERAKHIDLDYKLKDKDRGVFIVHPRTKDEEAVNEFLEQIYQRRNTGVFMDEPDLANHSDAFVDILRKGRTRRIPVITLSQRPVDVSRYVFSEATYIRVYYLNDDRDWDTVSAFTPFDGEMEFPKYHSLYYQVGDKSQVWQLQPAPPVEESLEKIDAQLAPERIFV